MSIVKTKYIYLFIVLFLTSQFALAQNNNEEQNVVLEKGIQILKKYFYQDNNWQPAYAPLKDDVRGLVNFIEDDPVDTIITNINNSFGGDGNYVFRLPENVEDSLTVPGFFAINEVKNRLEQISVNLQSHYQNKQVTIPDHLTANLDEKLNLVREGEGIKLFTDSIYTIPDSLIIPEVIPDSLLNSPENFEILRIKDSLRNEYIENKRRFYNDSLVSNYIDSLVADIRTKEFEQELAYQTTRVSDSVKVNNYEVLKAYNDSVITNVNDSIELVLKTLVEYADYIDTTKISILNLKGETVDIPLRNDNYRFSRVWLQNVQQDSLSVLVVNTDKRSVQMLIDDGVTISRYKEKTTKEFDWNSLGKDISGLTDVGDSYKLETPWRIGGDGHVGLTQTYLENWKKGGKSALSLLMVLKGFANYSRADGKIKWENSAEIRNGWIHQGGEDSETQKTDDKFEITSRYGVSAFKKWYYSAEFNYETQFFRGYRYPKISNPNPISSFMAPGKTFLKVGLEYKPNKNFSLLLSPFTLKNVYVKDTSIVDQTKFGIAESKKSFWEPGLNADIKFKTKITEDISYETKYKMFINYKEPHKKFDVNWENLFQMQLNQYVSMRLMLHFVYDEDVLFPVFDDNDVKIDEKPKLQLKEFFTIGVAYKINRNVMKSKRIR